MGRPSNLPPDTDRPPLHTHTHIHTHTHTHHSPNHTYACALTWAHMHACSHARMHTHTHTHTLTHCEKAIKHALHFQTSQTLHNRHQTALTIYEVDTLTMQRLKQQLHYSLHSSFSWKAHLFFTSTNWIFLIYFFSSCSYCSFSGALHHFNKYF